MRAVKIAYCFALLQFSAPLWAAEGPTPVAGTASIVAGAVSSIAPDGSGRVLGRNDAVYSGDRIITGAGGYVRIGFLDGSSMVLRPNTEFAIEGFSFQPGVVESNVKAVPPNAVPASNVVAVPALQIGSQGGAGNRAFFRLVRGGFRAVSGLVGKINREEYAVRTPVATIGIRGTAFSSVFCDAICAADTTVQSSLPAGETALGGTISAVDQGSIALVSNTGNTAVVQSSQFVLTTASGTHIVLPGLPAFLAGEKWLNVAQQAATAPPPGATAVAPTSQALASSALSTIPTVGSLATVILIGVTALATDTEQGTSTAPTATVR